MFGQNNTQTTDHIPEHSIQGVLDDGSSAHLQAAGQNWGHPGAPFDSGQAIVYAGPIASAPSAVPAAPAAHPSDDHHDEHQSDPAVNSDLIDIKQKALHQLSPLVNKLDQTPEEKFRTTMMMIQASDNQSLIPQAYEAANAIQDEKAKAQALLDIVNEINYFTQQQTSHS